MSQFFVGTCNNWVDDLDESTGHSLSALSPRQENALSSTRTGCIANVEQGSGWAERKKKKKRTEVVYIRTLACDPKEGFSRTSETNVPPLLSSGAGSVTAAATAEKIWGSPLKFESIHLSSSP